MSDRSSIELLGSLLGLDGEIVRLAKDYLARYSAITGRRVSLPIISAALYYSLINNVVTDLDLRDFVDMVNMCYPINVVNYRGVKNVCKEFSRVFGGKWRPTIRDIAIIAGRRLKLRDDEIEEIIRIAEGLKAKLPERTHRVLVAYAIRVKTKYSLLKIARTVGLPLQSLSNITSTIRKNLSGPI